MTNRAQAVPLKAEQREQVAQRIRNLTQQARELFGPRLQTLPHRFDLRGKCAAQFCRSHVGCWYRFNPWVFAADFEQHLDETLAHEVAHYVAHLLHPHRIRPHGPEWRAIMAQFGYPNARATGNYSLDGVPVRRQIRFRYTCACRTHYLSTTRHRRTLAGQQYLCRSCKQHLVWDDQNRQTDIAI